MKLTKIITLIAILPVVICSCIRGENGMNITLSTTDININELITTKYTDEQLKEINDFDGNIADYNSKYTIECIRRYSDIYCVTYCGESKIGVVWFDITGEKTYSRVHDISVPSDELMTIKVGDSLDDVQSIDPKGFYPFLYTGTNMFRCSNHYTSDGYVFSIEYDYDNIVISISKELI